jgi:ABC-type sugar transport system ATPase subunit
MVLPTAYLAGERQCNLCERTVQVESELFKILFISHNLPSLSTVLSI